MRVMAIDYGKRKSGLAVTDPLQLIVNGLDTISTDGLFDYLDSYLASEEVEKMVVGYPLHKDGSPTALTADIDLFRRRMQKKYPQLEIVYHDEAFTSVQAKQILVKSGLPKKKRKDKFLVDKISAVLILQDYLQHY